jgi:hypothetical protein
MGVGMCIATRWTSPSGLAHVEPDAVVEAHDALLVVERQAAPDGHLGRSVAGALGAVREPARQRAGVERRPVMRRELDEHDHVDVEGGEQVGDGVDLRVLVPEVDRRHAQARAVRRCRRLRTRHGERGRQHGDAEANRARHRHHEQLSTHEGVQHHRHEDDGEVRRERLHDRDGSRAGPSGRLGDDDRSDERNHEPGEEIDHARLRSAVRHRSRVGVGDEASAPPARRRTNTGRSDVVPLGSSCWPT